MDLQAPSRGRVRRQRTACCRLRACGAPTQPASTRPVRCGGSDTLRDIVRYGLRRWPVRQHNHVMWHGPTEMTADTNESDVGRTYSHVWEPPRPRPLSSCFQMTSKWRLVLASLALLGVGSCTSDAMSPEVERIGVVSFVEVEGGCWKIVHDNTSYEPVHLDPDYRIDGLRVEFSARLAPDLGSFCMVGTLVEITSIGRLD